LEKFGSETLKQRWTKVRDEISKNIRTCLWDDKANKFIPHIYLESSPFPEDPPNGGFLLLSGKNPHLGGIAGK